MSETMNLHQLPETMTSHRALWAGRIMSALVVIALLADGTIQLFAPSQIASLSQETGFAIDLTRVVGPIIFACAPEIIALLLGAMTWVGLYARYPRVRAILPFIR